MPALRHAVGKATIFGRVPPSLKARLVQALRDSGYWVAMIGDGVNDVLSLRQAQLGISMQSGSQATRAAADMVLLDDSFAALPLAVVEGQRIISGMQDSLYLFLSRAMYMAIVIFGAALAGPGSAGLAAPQHGPGPDHGRHPGAVPGHLGTARAARPRLAAAHPAARHPAGRRMRRDWPAAVRRLFGTMATSSLARTVFTTFAVLVRPGLCCRCSSRPSASP